MITDKLASYAVAGRETMPGVEHRRHKGLNNRAENSHQPTRRREKIMKRFKSAGQLQRFASVHDPISNLFHFPPPTIVIFAAQRWQRGTKSHTSLLPEISSVGPTAFARQ